MGSNWTHENHGTLHIPSAQAILVQVTDWIDQRWTPYIKSPKG